ncbi:ABC transporter permease [Rhodococcoides kroppenstedtii]|uniref:ABC transporter permease n=1 Tax=Rhodococcoides kroppenstedtii TaxID=293050 RepID=UPI001427B80A|nr:ABC transporter permease [Rhodococcus kroppenstedtii]NIL81905.1 putative doxorubicin resistance ABC transporter permease protein DrrC [Rhodococcus kroppenstedtii]
MNPETRDLEAVTEKIPALDVRTTGSSVVGRPRAEFPAPDHAVTERGPRAYVSHSLLQAKRLLTKWFRDPLTMIQTVIYPSVTLLMFSVVLGRSITGATGENAVYGQVPMIALVGSVFGALASGVSLKREAQTGLLTRFYVMPTHRASGLTGRLLAEAVRMVLTTMFIVLVGFAIGFRFDQGLLPAIAFFGLPLLLGTGFATFVTALAVMAPKLPLVELLSLVCTLLMFFNSGFVPTRAYPPWLQGFVANQPMSTAIESMRGLSAGGPVQGPLTQTAIWAVALTVIFAVPAVRGYRKAAMGRD